MDDIRNIVLAFLLLTLSLEPLVLTIGTVTADPDPPNYSHMFTWSCPLNWNPETQTMTDTNGLRYKTRSDGVITINQNRYLAFALKGTISGQPHVYTSMDFDWTWNKTETSYGWLFTAENNVSAFKWRQYYRFYNDRSRPMKIEHYLENNYARITDTQMYYLTNVLPGDVIEWNETIYNVEDYMGLHKQGNFTELLDKYIVFNTEYAFLYNDIIDAGFTINEFYIGNGGVLGKPGVNITAIGFTKGNGVFPKGSSVYVDPQFTTEDTECIDICVLDEDTIVIVWFDEVGDDLEYRVFNTNGTAEESQVTVDSQCQSGGEIQMMADAFNSTHFVIAWAEPEGVNTQVRYAICNRTAEVVNDVTVDSDAGDTGQRQCSVACLNETHFVVAWNDMGPPGYDRYGNATFSVYNQDGTLEINHTSIFAGLYSDPCFVDVTCFNETHMGFIIFDDDDYDVMYAVWDTDNTEVYAATDIDHSASNRGIDIQALNSTYAVFSYYNGYEDDHQFYIFDSSGNQKVGETDIFLDNSAWGYQEACALNSTYWAIIFTDDNSPDNSMGAVWDTSGVEQVGEWNVSGVDENMYAQSSISHVPATNLSIYDTNFVFAYQVNNSASLFTCYYANGSVWDGIVPAEPSGESFVRTLSQTLNWSGNNSRGTWNLVRSFSQGLTFTFNLDRAWSLSRSLTQGLTFSWNVVGSLTEFFETFSRALSLSLTWSGTLDRGAWILSRSLSQGLTFSWEALSSFEEFYQNYVRVLTLTLSSSFSTPTSTLSLLIRVINTEGAGLENVIVNLFRVGSTLIASGQTNSSGYLASQTLENDDYSIVSALEDYQTVNTLLSMTEDTVIEIELPSIEEGILLNFNIEILVFALIDLLLTGVMLTANKLQFKVMGGFLAGISWFLTALYWGIVNAGQNTFVFLGFFGLFGVLCIFLSLTYTIRLLDPYYKGDEDYF